MKHAFFTGICSGILVGIGGCVYLACDDRVTGAVCFSVALLSICLLGTYLYTGKIGLFAEEITAENARMLPLGLLGNWIGAVLTGLVVPTASETIAVKAAALAEKKAQIPFPSALILGFFCGILMYAAVKPWASHKRLIGVVFCIPAFILCGFEHSIADMFYMTAGRVFTPARSLFLLAVVIGNTLGGMLLPLLIRLGKPSSAPSPKP